MREQAGVTPFPDINEVLSALRERVEEVLGTHLLGLYVVGSLAVGDFDPVRSDLDFIVVTQTDIGTAHVQALQEMHAQFAEEPSPWAQRLEVIYAPQAALRVEYRPLPGHVPQLEKGTALFTAPLEDGWVFGCWTLRERGLTVCGPPPERLGVVTAQRAMAEAVRAVAAQWLHDAAHDPTWLGWLREREHRLFVVQTLCRMLYSLETGEVTSKPHALSWGKQVLGKPWSALVAQAVRGQPEHLDDETVAAMLDFIRYTLETGQRRLSGG